MLRMELGPIIVIGHARQVRGGLKYFYTYIKLYYITELIASLTYNHLLYFWLEGIVLSFSCYVPIKYQVMSGAVGYLYKGKKSVAPAH